jgi:hypothetical protein
VYGEKTTVSNITASSLAVFLHYFDKLILQLTVAFKIYSVDNLIYRQPSTYSNRNFSANTAVSKVLLDLLILVASFCLVARPIVAQPDSRTPGNRQSGNV